MVTSGKFSRVLERCEFLLDNQPISAEYLMKNFAKFLNATGSKDDHNVGFVLHTGSICFDAVALIYAIVSCLENNLTKTDDIVDSLSNGDIVLYGDKKLERYVFMGIVDHPIDKKQKSVLLVQDTKKNYVPPAKWRTILPYHGESSVLDGRGLKRKSNIREEFYKYVWDYEAADVPTVIDSSAVLVMQRDRANELFEKISIKFDNKLIKPLELVTATYYSENSEFPYGGNVAKAEPVIKVTSKMSVAGQLVRKRGGNSCIGLIVAGNEVIEKSLSEIPELLNRKSVKFVDLLMNMDSENALTLIDEVEEPNSFACSKEFLLAYSLPIVFENEYTEELNKQVGIIINRVVEPVTLSSVLSWEDYKHFKSAVFSIKNSDFISDKREDFIVTAFSLMNLLLTCVFDVAALDQCVERGLISVESVPQRILRLKEDALGLPESMKSNAESAILILELFYDGLKESAPKADFVKNTLSENRDKRIAIIVPKAYYATVMHECGMYGYMDREDLLTITTANRFDNSVLYDLILIAGNFTGKRFDAFKCMASEEIRTILYDFEENIYHFRARSAKKAINKINSMSTLDVDYEDNPDDSSEYSGGADDAEVGNYSQIDADIDTYVKRINEKAAFDGIERLGGTQSGGQQSEIVAVGLFDSGERAFFTKMYKAYVIDESSGVVKEVAVKDLAEGDSLVFTRNSSETKDIVDNVLQRLVETRKVTDEVINLYYKSKEWKKALRDYKNSVGVSPSAVADAMIANGVKVQKMTILGWLDEDSHTVGPRSVDSIMQIALLVGNSEMLDNAQLYYDACGIIRRIRIEILGKIGQVIIDKISGREHQNDELMGEIYDRVDSIAQVLRLESITAVSRTAPGNLANRPISV